MDEGKFLVREVVQLISEKRHHKIECHYFATFNEIMDLVNECH